MKTVIATATSNQSVVVAHMEQSGEEGENECEQRPHAGRPVQ